MATNVDRNTNLTRVRTELENMPKDMLEAFIKSLQRHSYSVHLPAHHSSRGLLGDSCSRTDILVLSGRDKTDNAGVAKLSLNSLLCGVVSEGLEDFSSLAIVREPDFVVTPHGSLPSFATVRTHSTVRQVVNSTLRDRDNNIRTDLTILDVTVDITTWKHDGSPAADTAFSWMCTVEAMRLLPF